MATTIRLYSGGDYPTIESVVTYLTQAIIYGLSDDIIVRVEPNETFGNPYSTYHIGIHYGSWNGYGIKFIANTETSNPPKLWGQFNFYTQDDGTLDVYFEQLILGAVSDKIVLTSTYTGYGSLSRATFRNCLIYQTYVGTDPCVLCYANSYVETPCEYHNISWFVTNAPSTIKICYALSQGQEIHAHGSSGAALVVVYPAGTNTDLDLLTVTDEGTHLVWVYGPGKTVSLTNDSDYASIGDPKLVDQVIQSISDTPAIMSVRNARQSHESNLIINQASDLDVWSPDILGNVRDQSTGYDIGAYQGTENVNPNVPPPVGGDYIKNYTGGPFDLNIKFNEAVYAFNPLGDDLAIVNGTKSNALLFQSNPTIWKVTITPTGEPLQLFIPSRAAISVNTSLESNCSTQISISSRQSVAPIFTVPPSRYDIGTVTPFTISINFGSTPVGFIIDDVIVTGGSKSNLVDTYALTGYRGTYNLTITPSGNPSSITYHIPAGAVHNDANKPNLASALYTTLYTYSSEGSIGGGGSIGGSGSIGGGGGGGSIDGSGLPSDGSYATAYYNMFTNASQVQLIRFPAIASTSSGTNISPFPIGWLLVGPSGYYYDVDHFPPNYGSGIITNTSAFLDFTSQSLDLTYSVKKSLNKNQIYAAERDVGTIYLPPTLTMQLSEKEVHVTSDGNMWAKSVPSIIRDVWILVYNDFMWHLQMPKPKYLGNDLLFIESPLIKCGYTYDPWSLFYRKGTPNPLNLSKEMRNHALGGFTWPVDGGVY